MTWQDKVPTAHAWLDRAIEEQCAAHSVAGIVILFSGGNDSSVLAHMFRERATHVAHCNTGIGIEQTRQFVRDTTARYGLPLLEKSPPPGSTYRELVLDQGFPGPAHHWKMYQRLKERGLRQVRADLVKKPRRERVIFLAGRRRSESARRSGKDEAGEFNLQPITREGSIVWVSPLLDWTAEDMNNYRTHFEIPRNEVSDMLHMSGECLCGAFAKSQELEEIGFFFPEVKREIEVLETEVRLSGRHPEQKCKWGWGADKQKASRSGPLCSDCDVRLAAVA